MSRKTARSVNIRRLRQTRLFKLVFIVIILLASVYWLAQINSQSRSLEVIFCDVGQGDAAIIKFPDGRLIMIDGGPDGSVLKCLGKNIFFGRRKIDYIILSHYHDDHVLGLPEVARRYRIKNFIYVPDENYSAPRDELIKYLGKQQSQITKLTFQGRLDLEKNCYLQFLNPAILKVPVEGNNSLVVYFSCRGKTFLFSGDNEAKVEKALLASNFNFSADIFKASHHGSKTSNSEDFLRAGGFKTLIISVGENKFGHPSPEVLERAQNMGIDIRRTDEDGTIKFIIE